MAKPLLFITGFLGAGKTTLLRSLLEELRVLGRTADVILNDFENAEIDASTLPKRVASIAPIAASCACCGSLDDLVKLCLAAQNSEGQVMLIELNGTADPVPLLETFTILEEKMSFVPRWQVGVVDARHWGQRAELTPLEVRQIETATHWMPSHIEDLSEKGLAELKESVQGINRYALKVNAEELAAEIAKVQPASQSGQSISREEPACPVEVTSQRGHEITHRFSGVQTELPGRFRREQIIRLLELLPDSVVRAKALVELDEPPGSRWLFERTGRHPVEEPAKVDQLTRVKSSLVCIGPGLEPDSLRDLVKEYLGV